MLEIKKIQDKDEQSRLCVLCGIVYMADALAYSAAGATGPIGIVQFAIREKAGVIYHIALCPGIDDADALFIMGRAAMNFVDLCGITDMYYEDPDKKPGRLLGFEPNAEGRLYMNLKGFFDEPCSCRK